MLMEKPWLLEPSLLLLSIPAFTPRLRPRLPATEVARRRLHAAG